VNAKQHFALGATVGIALNLIKQGIQMHLEPSRSFDWGELAIYGCAGGVAGVLPDILEPATDPNHRRFFHSVVFGGVALYSTHASHSEKWDPASRTFARTLCWCYLSHLGGDSTTPRGIPLV
jgi:membrane-bound metal-dependent hydrolase YbcI (DUF457 family)